MNKELGNAITGILERFGNEWNLNQNDLKQALLDQDEILGEGSKWTLKAYYDTDGSVFQVVEEQTITDGFWEAE